MSGWNLRQVYVRTFRAEETREEIARHLASRRISRLPEVHYRATLRYTLSSLRPSEKSSLMKPSICATQPNCQLPCPCSAPVRPHRERSDPPCWS